MKKYIIIIILGGLIWYVHSINPIFEDHMDLIDPDTSYESVIWDDLQYKDYSLFSATSSRKKLSMVSFGLCKYVKVVDEEWAAQQDRRKDEN